MHSSTPAKPVLTTVQDYAVPPGESEDDRLLKVLMQDHANTLSEASNQAKMQFNLSQLFITVMFTAFGFAFEKKIEAAFAILPLFGGICVMTLFWKDVIWYLAIKHLVELEGQINGLVSNRAILWATIHGECYIDYGQRSSLNKAYGISRLRRIDLPPEMRSIRDSRVSS